MLEFCIDPASEFHMPVFAQPSTRYVFYCGSGGRAALSALTAQQMGLDVYAILGGFKAWKAANLPREGEAIVNLEKRQ
jgi:rhodanese-related sulfurtransferase